MGFPLYLGPFQPFLEEKLLEELALARREDAFGPITVLTPNFHLTRHLRELAAEGRGSLFNVRFHTFKDAVKEAVRPVYVEEDAQNLPEALKGWILRGLVDANPEARKHYGFSRETPGFAPALAGALAELRQGGFTDRLLDEAARRAASSAGLETFAPRWRNLASLIRAYEAWKNKNRRWDQEDAVREAASRPPPGNRWIYGFYDPTPLQKQLLSAWATGPQSAWFVPYEEREACAYARPFRDWIASKTDRRIEAPAVKAGGTALSRLKAGWLEPFQAEEAAPDDGSVLMLFASGEREEIRSAARLLSGPNSPGRSAAFSLRVPEIHGRLVAETLGDFNLPLDNHLRRPLAATPEGRCARALLRCLRDDFPRAETLEFLGSPAVRPEAFDLREGDWNPPAWDALSKRAGVVAGPAQWLDRVKLLKRSREMEEEPARRGDLRSLEKALGRLLDWSESYRRAKGIDGKVRMLSDVLSKALVPGKPRVALLQSLSDLLDLPAWPGEEPSAEALVESLWENLQVGGETDGEGAIGVLDQMESRGIPWDTVILPGLWEKGVPPPPRPDPILPDGARRFLNGTAESLALDAVLPLRERRLEEERFLFYLALSSARENLVLSTADQDGFSGSPRTPSVFLLQAADILSGKRGPDPSRSPQARRFRSQGWVRTSIAECADRLEAVATALEEARRGNPAPALALLGESPFVFDGQALWERREGVARFTTADGVLEDPEALGLLAGSHVLAGKGLSASRLETYATCPFQYFNRYVLGLESLEEPEESLMVEALARGQLAHGILEKAFRRGETEGWLGTRDEEKALAALRRVEEDAFLSFERETPTGAGALWNCEKEKMKADIARTVTDALRDRNWRPSVFEAAFGPPEAPVVFSLSGGGEISLKGRIDRVDFEVGGAALRVVDYKTSRTSVGSPNQKIKGGTKIQLPVYLWAARTLFPDREAREARYLFIGLRGSSSVKKYQVKDKASWEDLRRGLETVLRTVSDGVERGFFPATAGNCPYCDFRALCGGGEKARAENKRLDAAAAPYYAMRDLP